MRRLSWRGLQETIESAAKMKVAARATLSISIPGIYAFDSTFWVDFLNADPENDRTMWPVYRDFCRAVQELKDWLTRKGYSYSKDVRDMRLLSEEEFQEMYPTEMQADAASLQSSMKEIIDEDRTDVIEAMAEDIFALSKLNPTWDKSVELPVTVSLVDKILAQTPVEEYSPINIVRYEPEGLELHMPGAREPKFWLFTILNGMISSCRDGNITVRRCLAPDCRKYFIPYSRTRNSNINAQKFDSPSCRSRYNSRRRRQSL